MINETTEKFLLVGKSATVLQEAQVKIVSPDKCKEQYSKVVGALINEKVICAGDKGTDTCQVFKNFIYMQLILINDFTLTE